MKMDGVESANYMLDKNHILILGSCMVKRWRLFDYEEKILSRWNEISTFEINRFKALAIILKEVDEKYLKIEDLETLITWVEETNELTNESLIREIDKNTESDSLRKAFIWSKDVEFTIERLNKKI